MSRAGLLVLVLGLPVPGCTGAAAVSAELPGTIEEPRAKMISKSPIPCRSGKDLAGNDGKRVRLVGVYRKSLTARKMRGPRTFHGYVHIELQGLARDHDPRGPPGKPIVELVGKRDPSEVERFVDRRVRVDGVLDLDPYRKNREPGVDHAAVIFGPPQLRDPRDLALEP